MSSQLYLPPHVQAAENKRFAEDIFRNVTANDPRAQECTAALQQIHSDLWMVRAHNTVDADLPLLPGFYHLLRLNDPAVAPMTVTLVHDGSHGWCEPSVDRVVECLKAGDLSQRRVRDRFAEQDRAVQEAIAKENAALNRSRREELSERVKAATETRISFNRDTPWTQNVQGKRGARR